MFFGLQLRSLLITDIKNEWRFSHYFSLRFYSMIVALIIILIYCIISNKTFEIIVLVAVLKAIEGLAEIFNAQQQLHERMRYVSRSLILKGMFATIGIAIGILFLIL